MASALSAPAAVRLEVRVGGSRPSVYEVGDGGFLVGGVPGCDLRLPGANLPPVLCLIARQPGGASLRKLAPVQPITLNGRPVSSTYLSDGDRVNVGVAELVVSIAASEQTAPPPSPLTQLEDRLRQIEAREKALREAAVGLEAERVGWAAHRDGLEAECGQQAELLEQLRAQVAKAGSDLGATRGDLERREEVCRRLQEEFTRKEADLAAAVADLARRETEATGLREEMTALKQQLSDRLGARRDRLLAQRQALRRAAHKVVRRKRDIDERQAKVEKLEREWALRQAELEATGEQVERERRLLEEQLGLLASRHQETQRDVAGRQADLSSREQSVAAAAAALERGQKQHQADLVRLDRIQAGLETRRKQLEQRALEVDRKFERLQRDSRELEEQAASLDAQHTRLTAESEKLDVERRELDERARQVEARAAAVEGQQTMLATLRTRLERMRDDLHRQEQSVSDQRALQEAGEADLAARRAEAERMIGEVTNERLLFEQERRRFDERRSALEQAVARLREAQQSLSAEQAEAETLTRAAQTTAAEQAEQSSLLLARGAQLDTMAAKIDADRTALREREAALTKAEATLTTLQEQVRQRVAECEGRGRDLDERGEALAAREAACTEAAAAIEAEATARRAAVDALAKECDAQAATVQASAEGVARLEREVSLAKQLLVQDQESLASRRQAFDTERLAWEVERQAAVEDARKTREEFEQARDEAQLLVRLLPELEVRAKTAQQGMERAREQLREHLAEIHGYSRQGRDELETARRAVQGDLERTRQGELELRVARDEHRLAVAAFRQQLIEWQGRVGEMKQTLQADGAQLQIRQADLEQRSRQIDDANARLARETESLERQRRQVAERRGEVDRHLTDMREWYRRKIRELAGVDAAPPGEGDLLPLPAASGPRDPSHAVLTARDDLEPADLELGGMLTELGLIDDDTRQALWAAARRQRRSLRQLLLAGGYLTLYQLALIEAGNLDGLVLGPVRVIDKLSSGPREAVYRVFDPRRNVEAVLRHLTEAEMHDAVRPDEFRQRFLAASAVQHELVAGVLEVLTIAGRPAALLEWVDGVPSSDLPGGASAPAVWFRLVSQAALALHAAHSAGVCHGRLDGGALLLTPAGRLKLLGLGEPPWLTGGDGDDSPAGDLQALGALATAWAAPVAGAKKKPLPDALQAVLERMTGAAMPFETAQDLLTALESAGAAVPAGTTAWDRLLKQTREAIGASPRRQSA